MNLGTLTFTCANLCHSTCIQLQWKKKVAVHCHIPSLPPIFFFLLSFQLAPVPASALLCTPKCLAIQKKNC